MEYFAVGSEMSEVEAYLYASGVVVMAALYTFTHHAYFFGVMHTGMRIRVAACSLLYRKVKSKWWDACVRWGILASWGFRFRDKNTQLGQTFSISLYSGQPAVDSETRVLIWIHDTSQISQTLGWIRQNSHFAKIWK